MKLEHLSINSRADDTILIHSTVVLRSGEQFESSDEAKLGAAYVAGLAAFNGDGSDEVVKSDAEPKRGRGRGKAEEAEPEAEDEPEEKPKRSRRAPAKTEEAEPEEKPTRARRGRGKAEEAEPEADAEPEEKPARARRGRAKPKDGISDEDLTKAASEAAEVVGPKVVKEILETFDVDTVQDIPQADRQEFLDVLTEEVGAD